MAARSQGRRFILSLMLLRVSDAALSFLTCCEAERRPVAAQMLGLATSLLEAAKRGGVRRGEVQQLSAIRNRRWRWNGRSATPAFSPATGAPDAPIRGAAGQPWHGEMAALGAYMSRFGLTLRAPCGRAEKWNPPTTLPALPSISRSCHCPAGLSPIVKRRVCGSGSAALAAKGAAPRPEHHVFPVCSAARQTCGALRC